MVRTDGLFFCGGTLISNKVVVTGMQPYTLQISKNYNKLLPAAHCILYDSRKPQLLPREFNVVLGAHNLSAKLEPGKVLVPVSKIRLHPDWNQNTASFDADIAVLELDERVTFSRFIQPICLIPPGSILLNIKHSIVAGFGRNDKDEFGSVLMMTSPIIYTRECVKADPDLESLLSPRMFCGGYANGTGACDGDSGSGFIVNDGSAYFLRAIVSSSLRGGQYGCDVYTYSVFTDVTKYVDWINGISTSRF